MPDRPRLSPAVALTRGAVRALLPSIGDGGALVGLSGGPDSLALAAAAACDLLDLAASATVSAPSPCDAAANNNATASDQPFACGRPIHLATSSPNKRAHSCSFLA